MITERDRAHGTLLGLAVGDAAGHPSQTHRAIRVGGARARTWTMITESDRHRITRHPTPAHLFDAFGGRYGPSDDAEAAAIGAELLAGPLDDPVALGARWAELCGEGETAPDRQNWLALSERGALINLGRGVHPPASGRDHPHYDDDAAVARAVPAGIRHRGDPGAAAEAARRLAELSHADDGVWAAQAMAAAIAAAFGGADPTTMITTAASTVPADSWLGRNLTEALALPMDDPLADLPELTERLANGHYSYGCLAPETLPIAFRLVLATAASLERAVPLAAMVHRQADSLPAMVGALCGAIGGVAVIPVSWRRRVDVLGGVSVPRLCGRRLADVADALLD